MIKLPRPLYHSGSPLVPFKSTLPQTRVQVPHFSGFLLWTETRGLWAPRRRGDPKPRLIPPHDYFSGPPCPPPRPPGVLAPRWQFPRIGRRRARGQALGHGPLDLCTARLRPQTHVLRRSAERAQVGASTAAAMRRRPGGTLAHLDSPDACATRAGPLTPMPRPTAR